MDVESTRQLIEEYARLHPGWIPPWEKGKKRKTIEEKAKEAGIDLEYHLKED